MRLAIEQNMLTDMQHALDKGKDGQEQAEKNRRLTGQGLVYTDGVQQRDSMQWQITSDMTGKSRTEQREGWRERCRQDKYESTG